jgi:hypothetical protein
MRVRSLYRRDDDDDMILYDDDGEEISIPDESSIPECDLRLMVLDGGYEPDHEGIALVERHDGSHFPVEVWHGDSY